MNKSILTVLLTTCLIGVAHAETALINVPKSLILEGFQNALRGVQIHIDNYGPRQGNSWLQQNSYVQLANDAKKTFNIPQVSRKVDLDIYRRYWRHYVDDMNSTNINIAMNGSKIVMKVYFESQGDEVKGKCYQDFLNRVSADCKISVDRDIQLSNASLEISLTPSVFSNSISFSNVNAVFKKDTRMSSSLCRLFTGLCGYVRDAIDGKFSNAIQNGAINGINSTVLKRMVATSVFEATKSIIKPGWKVLSVSSNGGDFTVGVERPDTVDRNTITVTNFSVVNKVAIISCPKDIKFNASIKAEANSNGQFWLEYEDNSKSSVQNWQMPKGRQSLKLSRPWNKNDSRAHSGTARMKLKWRGTDGRAYEKYSAIASFTRSCTTMGTSQGGFSVKTPNKSNIEGMSNLRVKPGRPSTNVRRPSLRKKSGASTGSARQSTLRQRSTTSTNSARKPFVNKRSAGPAARTKRPSLKQKSGVPNSTRRPTAKKKFRKDDPKNGLQVTPIRGSVITK